MILDTGRVAVTVVGPVFLVFLFCYFLVFVHLVEVGGGAVGQLCCIKRASRRYFGANAAESIAFLIISAEVD